MKRCPKCNQEFVEEWLTFCTSDGTPLTEAARSTDDPPPTIVMPQPPVTAPQEQRPTIKMPPQGAYGGPVGWPQQQQPVAPVWRPPPPPYVQPQNKSLATASMVLGIIGVVVGWMCFGPALGIVAIVLGCIALSQIKKSPERVSGKPLAWVGIVTGSLSLLFYAGLIAFYIIVAIIGSSH